MVKNKARNDNGAVIVVEIRVMQFIEIATKKMIKKYFIIISKSSYLFKL